MSLWDTLYLARCNVHNKNMKNFIGCKILEEIQIHPPNDVRSKGRSKRIKRAKELPKPRKMKNLK
jgi:hypothetical protein